MEEVGLRHAFFEVGSHTILHPFQVADLKPPGSQPMFQRDRLEHFGLNAARQEAFTPPLKAIVLTLVPNL